MSRDEEFENLSPEKKEKVLRAQALLDRLTKELDIKNAALFSVNTGAIVKLVASLALLCSAPEFFMDNFDLEVRKSYVQALKQMNRL